jgi:hypothetical protein
MIMSFIARSSISNFQAKKQKKKTHEGTIKYELIAKMCELEEKLF